MKPDKTKEPLAIIGIGCRFPGDSNSPETFWKMMCDGTDAISKIPPDRWNIKTHYNPKLGKAGRSITKWGGFIKNIDQFDPAPFGISPREAECMDPQQRLLLEASWNAFEDAGQPLDKVRGSNTGVFVGISTIDYHTLQISTGVRAIPDIYSATGTAISIAANRVSYSFDLRGPSMSVDTACSSALIACHTACRSLWRGDCTQAIVGGVNALLTIDPYIAFSRMGMLSPEGRCKAFDSRAKGFVRAEGVGAVLLKPLSAALADGDSIYAVIRGTAANQDGRTNGITVPSPAAQEALVRLACADAEIAPGKIDYVEAHGTGTPVGDPIEAYALGMALREGRNQPCPMGSVKTNFGHMEAAAGIASLIKVALLLKHRVIPPSLHFKKPNPNIDFQKLKLRVVRELEKFPATGPLHVGINSFGFGGANAHVILESAPVARAVKPQKPVRKTWLLPLAAHSKEALQAVVKSYLKLLSNPRVDAHAICAAVARRSSQLLHRVCVTGDSRAELVKKLKAFLAGETGPGIAYGEATSDERPVFVFSGQGPQWWGMGRELLKKEPVFRQKLEACDELFREFGGWSLLAELGRNEKQSRLQQTRFAQPAIFALQVALADLWQSWGVRPAAVVGHSVGEVAAAHLAGIFTLREAARVIFHRGRCMNAAPTTGRMLAASLDAAAAELLAAEFPGQVTVAAFNGPNSVALSGEGAALEKIARTLETRGIFNRFLQVQYAFHSHQMDPIKAELLEALGTVETAEPKLKIYSTVTGLPVAAGADFGMEYWWRNVRKPVRFCQAIQGLAAQGHRCFLELSAHPALVVAMSETLAQGSTPGKVFSSLRRKEPEQPTMLAALGALHVAGSPVEWKGLYPGALAVVKLPEYPWQRERYWRETDQMHLNRLGSPDHPFLQVRMATANPVWNSWLDLDDFSFLSEHRVGEHIVFPAAGYVETILAMGGVIFKKLPIEIEDLQLKKAIILPENRDPMRLQMVYAPGDETVKLSSSTGDKGAEWMLNATAKLRPLAETRPGPVDVEQIKRRMTSQISHERVYEVYRDRNLPFGPAFQGVETVWRRDGESLGLVRLPKSLKGQKASFLFHPALLDACFQTVIFTTPGNLLELNITQLPERIDRIKIHAPATERLYCHARNVSSSFNATVWQFRILDQRGRVLIELESYRAQLVRGASITSGNNFLNWLYEPRWIEKPLAPVRTKGARKRMTGTWLLLADRRGVAEELATKILRQDGHPVLVFTGTKFQRIGPDRFEVPASSLAEWKQMMAAVNATNGKSLAGIVHFWNLDATDTAALNVASLEASAGASCHSVLNLIQTLAFDKAAPPLWIATRLAQPVSGKEPIAVAQAPAVGVGRTINTELAKWPCRMVDLDSQDAKKCAEQLAQEILKGDGETEAAYRDGKRFGLRLARASFKNHPPRQPESPKTGYHLEIPPSGVMDELELVEHSRREPGPNDVEIEVCAASLNFRDVMKSLGIYPMNSDLDLLLGDECSGRVVSVGRKVKQFKAGDEVIASAVGCFASHITIPAQLVMPKPPRISFAEAATIPVAFMTAWYTLHTLGHIRRGEKVLIHAATGGVGLAAIQIAKAAGAEIFATAGSDEKRNHLRKLGIRHVMDSRSTEFAAEVLRITGGRGVDLVLNSLAGDAISKGLSVLAPGGRFLEIGKRDVYANTAIGLRPMRNNVAMFVVDMAQVMAENPAVARDLMENIFKNFSRGKFQPLAHQALPISDAVNAFRLMARAKHIGKIVLTMDGVKVAPWRMLPKDKLTFPAKAAYIVTGGLGGFGLVVAQWLAAHGAKHLILTSRSGASTPEAKQAVAALKKSGTNVLVVKADIASERDVARLFQTAAAKLPPVRGIFHAAMVLDDGVLPQLTPERFARVMAPKVTGGWNLHVASAKLPLDHFILFSSVSSLAGAAGQGNYVAANTFLDMLAHYRNACGLPALSVNWGAIGEVGFVARNAKVAEHLTAHGVYGLAPAKAVFMLGRLMQSSMVQAGLMHIDWQKYFSSGSTTIPPKFSLLATASAQAGSADSGEIRNRILSAPVADRPGLTAKLIAEAAAKVLRTNVAKLDANRPLKEMGLDSLMAFELLNRLETMFGITLPPSRFTANATINHLATVTLDILGGSKTDAAARPSDTKTVAGATAPAAQGPAAGKQLLTLRTSQSGTPLILIHPAGGLTNIYDDVAAELPAGYPVLALQSRVLAGAGTEWATMEQLTADYAGIITRQFPDGELRLGGFSVGGLFALATAAELERSGRKVELVGLIDAPLSILDPDCARADILKGLFHELNEYFTPGSGLDLESAKIQNSLAKMAEKAAAEKDEAARSKLVTDWLVRHQFNVDDLADASVQKYIEIFNRHASLVLKMKTPTLSAPVWHWRAATSRLTLRTATPELQDRITRGSFVEEPLEGRHYELMNQPAVKTLAERMARVLAEPVAVRRTEPLAVR